MKKFICMLLLCTMCITINQTVYAEEIEIVEEVEEIIEDSLEEEIVVEEEISYGNSISASEASQMVSMANYMYENHTTTYAIYTSTNGQTGRSFTDPSYLDCAGFIDYLLMNINPEKFGNFQSYIIQPPYYKLKDEVGGVVAGVANVNWWINYCAQKGFSYDTFLLSEKNLDFSRCAPGDLVFFYYNPTNTINDYRSGNLCHIGFYGGNGMIYHCALQGEDNDGIGEKGQGIKYQCTHELNSIYQDRVQMIRIFHISEASKSGLLTSLENVSGDLCIEDGYSGDVVCAHCKTLISSGETLPMKGHAWEESFVEKEPTIYEEGIRKYICSRNPEHMKTEVIPKRPIEQLEGYSMSLSKDIHLNFFFTLDPKVFEDEDAYIQFSYENGNHLIQKIQEARQVENQSVFTVPVSAKGLTEKVSAQIHLSNGDSGELYTYSPEDYLIKVQDYFGKESKEADIAKRLSTYGYYAQSYFEYNTDRLPTILNPLQEVKLSDYDYKVSGNQEKTHYIGARLVLKDKLGLKLYFKTEEDICLVNGNEVETTTEQNWKIITIYPENMYDTNTIEFSDLVLHYSIATYGKVALQTGNKDLIHLIQAMTSYYELFIE
ncbi:MAG: hypothetical protein Q4C49_06060 [Bacillota bacterium]|nr:hypothetical protein [Bacillota bacterium]